MRVVLDANIYVSSLISDKGNPAKIIKRWLVGEFEILLSPAIIDEILRVTAYGRIQRKYTKVGENRLEFVELLSKNSLWIEPWEKLAVVPNDESDNRYLECAETGGAQYIVTGDKHLLELGSYKGILIITPAAFIALLEIGNL
jgi:putative PIN family toxin of toxin-antitoxin system